MNSKLIGYNTMLGYSEQTNYVNNLSKEEQEKQNELQKNSIMTTTESNCREQDVNGDCMSPNCSCSKEKYNGDFGLGLLNDMMNQENIKTVETTKAEQVIKQALDNMEEVEQKAREDLIGKTFKETRIYKVIDGEAEGYEKLDEKSIYVKDTNGDVYDIFIENLNFMEEIKEEISLDFEITEYVDRKNKHNKPEVKEAIIKYMNKLKEGEQFFVPYSTYSFSSIKALIEDAKLEELIRVKVINGDKKNPATKGAIIYYPKSGK